MEHLYTPANKWKRLIAYIVGFVMLFIIQVIIKQTFSPILPIITLVLFCKDGVMQGQSPAKKIFDLMVVNVKNNKPCSLGLSFKRNLLRFIFNISFICFIRFHQDMSIETQLISVITSIIVLTLNIIYYFRDGRMLHDRWAGTMVINKRDYNPNVISE